MLLISSCSCLYLIRWSQVLSWEWRCSWSSADRRCSNYIWVINNLIAYWSAPYIRDLTVTGQNIPVMSLESHGVSHHWQIYCLQFVQFVQQLVRIQINNKANISALQYWIPPRWRIANVERISMGLLPDTQNFGCACASNAGIVYPATAGKRSRHASRHVRDERAVMHAGIANQQFPLKSAVGENVPGIPGACATRSFTYQARCSWHDILEDAGNWTVPDHNNAHKQSDPGPLFITRWDVLPPNLVKSRSHDVMIIVSLWNLAGISVVLLLKCLQNVRAIGKV